MKIKCVAIDDEPLALVIIEKMVKKFPMLHLVATFDDAISGAEFLRQHPIDLLLIDINMPDISGLQLVRSLENKPMIIFITAHKNFAIDSYELDALDYLVKPVQQERLDKAVNKAIEYYSYKNAKNTNDDEVLFVRAEYQLIKINLSDVEYIESMEDYSKFHLVNGKPVMTLMTLKSLLDKLPPAKFKRVHRSYIVSLNKITSIANRKLVLISVELPVSNSYLPSLEEWIKR
jgi:two-component system, LytTR family, response regulator